MAKSKVIILKSSKITGEPNPADVGHLIEMLGEGLMVLASEQKPQIALNEFIPPAKRVGIKPNCLTGKMTSSSPTLCNAIAKLLSSSGIKEEDIVIWERSERELKKAGYQINYSGSGPKVIANDSPGVGYGSDLAVYGKVGSLITRALTDMVDYHINYPVLKDHSLAGLSSGLKNFYGAVHNPNKYHDNNCDPYAADVYSLPVIKEKNRLTIMDCFKIQYNGGPAYNGSYAINSNMILISDDPVAIDVIALQILEDTRRQYGLKDLKSVGRYPSYLKTAADTSHKLGNFEIGLIEKVEITV